METQLLREQDVFPEKEVLKNALGDSYLIFEELMERITAPEYGLVANWNFYKDGKAWICKITFRKKQWYDYPCGQAILSLAFISRRRVGQGCLHER